MFWRFGHEALVPVGRARPWTVPSDLLTGQIATRRLRVQLGVSEIELLFQRYVNMLDGAGLAKCLALAVASTAAWYLVYRLLDLIGGSADAVPANWSELGGWLLFWFTGTIYSVLVLFRYLDSGNLSWRPIVVGLGGAFSYWIGVQYVMWQDPLDTVILDSAVAGVITAAFIGYLVIQFGTVRFAWWAFAFLCAGGALGGATIGWTGPGNEPGFIAGHAMWQILTCAALFHSPKSVLREG